MTKFRYIYTLDLRTRIEFDGLIYFNSFVYILRVHGHTRRHTHVRARTHIHTHTRARARATVK